MKQHYNNKEAGLTGLGFIFILLILGFFVALGLKLVPVYLEYYNVTTSLQSLEKENSADLSSRSEIKSLLKKRLQINDVTSVSDQDISIEKKVDGTLVTVEYEVRKNFLGNVDIVVTFKDSVELAGS
ncbi:MAG TPA: DUF4845 domain-containing protein [Gammaproteobacteria bacterium]|nr:DUF4845 domain-containing protein [Gammaproteobacteria bacterium]